MITAGESKGQSGRVIRMLPKQYRAVVEGMNMVSKHQKPSASSPQGGIQEMEAPIHLSNLMIIDSKDNLPTKTGRKTDDKGNLVRFSKKSGEIIK